MPSVIPYDPSLVLGNLVNQAALDNLVAVSAIQAPIDAAEDNLNALIALKRSIDMTIQELINMGIDTTDLVKESAEAGKSIQTAAVDYAKQKVDGASKIYALMQKVATVHEEVESPIDYNKTQIKTMPLAADSLKMNVQYFSFDENQQDAFTQAATVKSFVSSELDILGDSFKEQASSAAQDQMNSQYQKHSISGTLVISITCTHKDALLLAPFIMDVDKAIRVWNKIYPGDMLKINDPASIAKAMAQTDTQNEKSLTLLSGATYGSCFIGMVHILNTTTTTSTETAYSAAESLQSQFAIGGLIEHLSGGFGVDSTFSADAKNLLSTQNITSHVSLVTMGSIPSIKSNQVALGVKQFASFDGATAMQQLAALQNATAGDMDTVDSSATAARTGQQMLSMQNAKIQGVLTGLADIDDGANKMLDINSMMDAMDDYIQKALAGNIGVPINYYLKPITKSQLAEMWVSKYYPNKYTSVSGDDSTPSGGGGTDNSGSSGGGATS
ncbi:hypothetical protein EGT74_16620 [Chitinophaga lutea]|uniref:Uncharacterized protein n=1 Tax=Chitinophaga lutea TaxID=2488634 RepID=A0A3N4PIZ1_9BACT|nr:hypothetical protein [Chitinophaga lutea]RPE08662.1 hypothetical protein EGT74_16620 [Chitinophaga lutea]